MCHQQRHRGWRWSIARGDQAEVTWNVGERERLWLQPAVRDRAVDQGCGSGDWSRAVDQGCCRAVDEGWWSRAVHQGRGAGLLDQG